MDSYDLFGEDGAGMLEGLPELGGGGGDHFDPAVTGARDATPAYAAQPTYSQETPLQKLASFGGADFNHMDPNAQSMYAQGYGSADRPMGPPGGSYPPHQRQMARPPGPQAATGQYPYQPENMYTMLDHQMGMGDAASMQSTWGQQAGYPMHRYSQMAGYRQQAMTYGHQQEQKQQFPPTQHPMMQQPHQTTGYPTMQQRHAPTHYPQGSGYPSATAAAAGQNYGSYIHQRMPHHHAQYPQTHHQLEMGVNQTQQYNHMTHAQTLSGHTTTHPGAPTGHMTQTHPAHPPSQTHAAPSQQTPTQNPMVHPNMSYNQHQTLQTMQRPMEVPPTSQQFASKHSAGPLGNASPQYRAPFPQLSPQISPRPQMSPRPPAPQMSPRPVMSPAKPNLSPHPQMQQTTLSPRPATSLTPKSTTASPAPVPPYSQQSTLQALEQMVMPPSSTSANEYPSYQSRGTLGPPQGPQNPLSPAMGVRNPLSEQWPLQQRPHVSNMNGNLTLLDQNQIPTSQGLLPTQQTLPPSHLTNAMQNTQNMPTSFANEDLRSDINKPQVSMVDLNASRDSTSQGSLPSQNELNPVQSPGSSSLPDKIPSSTTNTDVNTPSVPLTLSHPPTPTPSSTTDDVAINQEKCLPVTCDSIKSTEDSNSSSNHTTSQQHPSQTSQHSSFDFSSVTSLSMYASSHTQKVNKMDDLMPSTVFSQDTSIPHDTITDSQSPTHPSSLQTQVTPSAPNRLGLTPPPLSSANIPQSPMSQTPPISMQSQIQTNQMQSAQMMPNSSMSIQNMLNQSQGQAPPQTVPHDSHTPPMQMGINQVLSHNQVSQHNQVHPTHTQIPTHTQLSQPLAHNQVPQHNQVPLQHSQVAAQHNQLPTQHNQVPLQHNQVPPPNQAPQLNQTSQHNQAPPLNQVPPINQVSPLGQVSSLTQLPQIQQPNTQGPNMQQLPSITNLTSSQTPSVYEQNAMMGPNTMQIGGPITMPPHGMAMGHPRMAMGVPAPGMMPGVGAPGHGMLPGQDIGYQPPISHHQERAALQQQLQELFCMPPAPEHQEKIVHLQERLNILTQHEATEQCNGGPQCVLQSPLFTSPMIDSPQVSSTTGRGRGKGTPRTKKPRQKKGEKGLSPIQIPPNLNPMLQLGIPQQLPVSEDCVTPGAGLNIPSGEMSDVNDVGMDSFSGDDMEKGKKSRTPRKPREPKKPKEPKPPKEPKAPKTPKPPKERKKKEPKDPKMKRKYVRKKKGDGSLDESMTDEFNKSFENGDEIMQTSMESTINEKPCSPVTPILIEDPVPESTNEEEPLQVDSQTVIEDVVTENEEKKDEYIFDDTPSPKEIEELPKKPAKKSKLPAQKKVVSSKAKKSSGGSSKSRKRKGGIVPESDGECEDLASTPPPSPPEDPESATHKRRSARNTQRKKYIDDVMLRFSDDETPLPSRSKKTPVTLTPPITTAASMSTTTTTTSSSTPEDSTSIDGMNKPNFVYINTTDEDSMVVQYVLTSRMTTRERKLTPVEIPQEDTPKEGNEVIDVVGGEKKDTEILPQETPSPPKKDAKEEILLEMEDVEEYYVKYRNFSYLHCEWKTEDELYKGDKRIANKIKRYKQKQAQQLNIFENLEDEHFNPDYIEVDRVLDVAEHTDPSTQETVKHFLVKWRSLQYEDSTWELEEDVDPIKIEQFEKFRALPSKDKWKPKKRPTPESWVKLEISPLYKGANKLREYQLEGLNWLLFSWYNNRNCILADEMGLGKTIQSLTFLNSVNEYGIRGPFLVIAPLSTIPNWQREIESWTDMNVVVYHGSSASRNMIHEYETWYKNDKGQPIKELTKFNILITTFEIIVTDFADLKGFNWRICVIDEAHRLKNRNCKLLEGLRQLSLEHRVLLSGTPLQNNVNELFSLLNFLEPTQFASSDAFLQEFGALKSEQEVSKLQLLLKPMMLRRLKEDVEKSLAPKEETVVEVELTNIQKKYYRGILERNFSFLSKGTTHANIPNLMNTMMELRKCCIHPYLLNGAEDQIQYDYKQQHGEDIDAYYKALIQSSGKMVLIDKLLPKLKANGHRVLVFSQMVRCLDILEDYLMFKKYPYERIDGRIRGNLRQAAIDRFSRPDSDRFVFLLCTKAGGLGINLTAADTVIIYDSDWNPQNDLQAQARCHRIGQQKMVKIYRLLCRNTYEREMFDKASLKLGLDKAILQSMNTSQGGKEAGNRQLSKKEIEDLLKKGAYGALLDEEKESDKFCEEDIDIILARRTQVITMESEKGSTFSKATFAASANRSDINIDDPDFWNKWAKKADIDTTEKDETEDLVISEPRRRTQIKRYGHDESAIDMSELETSSESDLDGEGGLGMSRSRRNKLKNKKRLRGDDYIPREGDRGDIVYGSWARRECFMIERGLLTFGWGRWKEILMHSQLRKGWREQDVEDCARVILLYCLRFYRGDEKIRNFIWDLITPFENGEQKMRNHLGLKDPVPRGIRNKNKKKGKDTRHAALTDPNHWSKNEKYDGDIFLESNYKKHLGRHANKVLLRVRMLYYIKHEIIGDLVQHIADGVNASALPINPPVTEQLPCDWWDADCDKSLLVGTWKHGYENYTEMRADPTLCFLSRCGPPSARELQMASNTQPSTPALNDDDIDDEDTNEEMSVRMKHRDGSEQNSEFAEPSPGPSGSSETQPSGDTDDVNENDDKQQWPSITDLNTRLRRVITSYQRSYRKEEQKMAAAKSKNVVCTVQPSIESALTNPLAALAQVSQQLEARDASQLGLPGWDLQQLALYLLKMERQGKQLEQAIREKERQCIAKRWTRREEADFFRVASSYGIIYSRKKKSYDWSKFKQLSKLEKKTDEELTEYYKSFVVMCKKQTGLKLDEENYDTSIEHLTEEKARRTLERLELLSRIREEVITHPKLDDRLKVCMTSADMPEWWVPGKHDKDLLLGVAKHGLGRTDYYILNDPELSFQEILRKKVTTEPSENKDAIKLESPEDILKFDRNEILVKLEKGEGTLKIEKVGVKKEEKSEEKEEKPSEQTSQFEMTLVKTEDEEKSQIKKEVEVEKDIVEENVQIEKNDDAKEVVETEVNKTNEECEVKKDDVEPEKIENSKQDEIKIDEKGKEADLCSKQAAELKAMFPDLEVIQPLSRLSQIDTFVLRDRQGTGALDFSETTVAQLFNNAVKWPKEYAIQVRLQHIIYALETKEWPASKTFSAYASGIGNEFDIPIHEIPNDPPKRDSSTPMSMVDSEVITITTDSLNRGGNPNKKRKRHIAIDVETERAKLHALLNSTHVLQNPMVKHPSWDNEDSEDSRRSTPVSQSNLQPPPAHQQTSSRLLNMPYDLKYPIAKTIGQTTVIPGTSSTLTPIDLSSGLPKMNSLDIPKTTIQDLQNEVQDFSMPSKKQQVSQSSTSSTNVTSIKAGTNKLDDTLTKLMKRKNCPVEEPVIGKEKKRRKLDEIVLGLSAAKEQSLFPETSKKPSVTPSVTVTPTSAPVTSHSQSQKPFTITVTSVPSPAPTTPRATMPNMMPSVATPAKDSFSTFLAQAEQQNLLLKKQQQQQRKSYEAMIADINKVTDFSKVNSYSHEAKVNKWLAEQNAALAEQPLNADYLAQRRRRPRIDPTLLDWKKLTGDENVSVINRVTGKKLTGPKAPTLKRLGQWLMENPMYDIDPKWSELVKERGNLSNDLQKRLQGNGSSNKRGAPGRPPLLASPTGSTSSVSSANLATSMASSLSFPSLGGTNLSGINTSLLSGLSGLGQFDSKNPLLMPFAGMPNMNTLSSMGGLNNLTNMNLFANLAGLGLPGLAGMDPSLAAAAAAAESTKTSSATKSKQQKPSEAHSSSKPSTSTSSSIPTTNPFPFFFPNPSLLYTPLGLGALNPFTLQPAYDTLAQQCGLLNGNLNPAASPNSNKSSKSNSSRTATSTTTTTSSTGKSPRSAASRDVQQQQLQQLLLPPDTHLLESLSKVAGSLEPSPKQTAKEKKDEKRKALESLRGMLPSDFSNPDKLKDKKAMPGLTDFSKLFETTPITSKKSQEQQMKEALEQLSKNEFLARAMGEEQHQQQRYQPAKRPRETSEEIESLPQEETPIKKPKEENLEVKQTLPPPAIDPGVDIETLLPPSTVVKVQGSVHPEPEKLEPVIDEKPVEPVQKEPNLVAAPEKVEPEVSPKKNTKRTRGKRKSGELPIDPESIREKKNLRSSASRSAAAAAARAEREQAAAKLEIENAQKEKHDA